MVELRIRIKEKSATDTQRVVVVQYEKRYNKDATDYELQAIEEIEKEVTERFFGTGPKEKE